MEPHRLFGRGRLKIKDSVVQDVGYLDKHVSGDLCLRTYLIESQSSGHDWICVDVEETCENININKKLSSRSRSPCNSGPNSEVNHHFLVKDNKLAL